MCVSIYHATVIDKVRKTLVAMKKASTSQGADPEKFKTTARCGVGCETDERASVLIMT